MWECLWKKWAFELVNWVKQIAFPGVGRCHLICWRPGQNKRAEESWIYFLPNRWPELEHCLLTSAPLVLRPSHCTASLPGSLHADEGTLEGPHSCEPIPYNKFHSYWLCFSGEPWLIQCPCSSLVLKSHHSSPQTP